LKFEPGAYLARNGLFRQATLNGFSECYKRQSKAPGSNIYRYNEQDKRP